MTDWYRTVSNPRSLALYRYLDQIGLLRTYAHKVLFVVFLGAYLPLIGLVIFLYTRYEPFGPSATTYILAVATIVGLVAVHRTLDRLPAPIRMATDALDAYLDTGKFQKLPEDLHDEAGTLLRDVNRAVQVFEQHRCELERAAHTDFLTGVWNRRGMQARIRERGVVDYEHPACIVLIDIDNFKEFNDRWGHSNGDIALQRVAECLSTTVAAEKGCEDALIARWGGEEFLVLLPFSIEGTYECVERMRRDLRALLFHVDEITDLRIQHLGHDRNVATATSITISAGICALTAGEAIEKCISCADRALYFAKQEGRDRTRLCRQPVP